MLKALIDVTPVTSRPSGVGFYVINLVRALQAIALESSEPHFQVETLFQPRLKNWLLRRPFRPKVSYTGQTCHLLDMPVRLSAPLLTGAYHSKPLYNLLASQVDGRLLQGHLDGQQTIIHGTNYSVCPSHRAKTVMTIYDLTYIRYPEFVDRMVHTYREQVAHCLNWTDLVLTISESSKRDIVEYLGVDAQKVWVTPLASQYAPTSCPVARPLEAKIGCWGVAQEASVAVGGRSLAPAMSWPQHFQDRRAVGLESEIRRDEMPIILDDLAKSSSYDREKPYLLFVSTIEPRKNISSLVEAFNRLKSDHGIEHDLLLVGKKGWHYEPIFEAIARSPWRDNIHHLNYLSDRQVQALYSHADIFVYPSFYEGFGLPVLEAMTLGAPVVTSNVSSLPEVAGDAALYANPHLPAELAEQIWRLIDSPSLRENLISRGHDQAAKFSWRMTAEETLKAYRSLL